MIAKDKFIGKITNSLYFNFFLLIKLPMAFIARLRVDSFTEQHSHVSLPFYWLTQNPFKSIYFG